MLLAYGMAVTSPVRDAITYTDDWKVTEPDYEKALEKYNNDKNRFLYYPWGVWVTAYARARLMRSILAVGEQYYMYSDTDSNKYICNSASEKYFSEQNAICDKYLADACAFHHFPVSFVRPKTIKGIEKPLGYWDSDGYYRRFKSLRAKAYAYEDRRKNFHITVSGLNKEIAAKYLIKKYGRGKVFKQFDDELSIDPEYTGKNTHTYIDKEISGYITDFQGNVAEYHELSFVHLEAAGYDLSLKPEYVDYILSIGKSQEF